MPVSGFWLAEKEKPGGAGLLKAYFFKIADRFLSVL